MQPYPTTGAQFQISRGGGVKLVWRRDGRELYYLVPGGALMVWRVTRAGPRFIMNARTLQSAALPLTVSTNWLAAFHQ